MRAGKGSAAFAEDEEAESAQVVDVLDAEVAPFA